MRTDPKSLGGDDPVSRRCWHGQHSECKGSWTQYPDSSGPCECDCHSANNYSDELGE